MKYVCAQISIFGGFEGEDKAIQNKLEEAINMACTYLENELKHDSITYTLTSKIADDY